MDTKHNDTHDPLRNPQVDYDRSDLSPRGILLFLVGLFVAGLFVELVMWGMFHFLARSEALFPQGTVSPMQSAQRKAVPENQPGAIMQNTPNVNLSVFPQPRLQADDAAEMQQYVDSEQKLLNPPQPFTDSNGAVHIPITLAMKLITERGLPTRPNAPPPPEIGAPGNPGMGNESPKSLPMGGAQ